MERCQQLHLWSIGKQRKRKNRWRRVRHSFVPCQLVLNTVDPCSVYPFSHSTLPNHSLHHLYMRQPISCNFEDCRLWLVFLCAVKPVGGKNIWSSQFIFGALQGLHDKLVQQNIYLWLIVSSISSIDKFLIIFSMSKQLSALFLLSRANHLVAQQLLPVFI